MEELLSFGVLAAEIFFERSNAWYNLVRNFIVSIVVLVNSCCCVQIQRYKGLYKPMCLHLINYIHALASNIFMCLHLIYRTLAVKGIYNTLSVCGSITHYW